MNKAVLVKVFALAVMSRIVSVSRLRESTSASQKALKYGESAVKDRLAEMLLFSASSSTEVGSISVTVELHSVSVVSSPPLTLGGSGLVIVVYWS